MNTLIKSLFITLFWLSAFSLAQAATYYVAPTGNDANPGTISQPFATLPKAVGLANPADTIYMRGGTYTLTDSGVQTSRSGSSGNPIKIFNYPGENPIIDGINITTDYRSALQFNNASWWHLQGLEIKNAGANGIYFSGASNNNIIERCVTHHNVRLQGSGAGINVTDTSANNLILNNDSHHNGREGTSGGDGIGVYGTQGAANIVRGNRVWRNRDDGIDLFDAANVLVENNWSWENGYDDALVATSGNGAGFKLGGSRTGDGNHTVRNNLAWRNQESGFDDNSADLPMFVYNNTGWENNQPGSSNFAFYSAVAHVLKNNIAFTPNTVSFNGAVQHSFNSWNLAVTVNSADFVTLDFTANLGARNADGSLPDSNFLKLVPGSDLIDKGTNVGIPYTGSAPDLGAYDYINSVVSLQPPTNLVVQ